MCVLCVEINKGNLRTRKEVFSKWNGEFNSLNIGNHLGDVIKLIDTLPDPDDIDFTISVSESTPTDEGYRYKLIYERAKSCTCGAKHTSFPNKHSTWCDKE